MSDTEFELEALRAEAKWMRQNVVWLESEVSKLRADVAARAEQMHWLGQSVRALQRRTVWLIWASFFELVTVGALLSVAIREFG